jgi:alkylhydroperoxidase family enzyme
VFLNLLDSDEKRAFAELAEKMIEADGLVIGREEASLAALKAEMGITGGGSGRGVEELAGVFHSGRSKVAALLELIGLGYSDVNYSVNEKSMVDVVARQMGLSSDELATIEAWVRDHVSLIRRALILMRD